MCAITLTFTHIIFFLSQNIHLIGWLLNIIFMDLVHSSVASKINFFSWIFTKDILKILFLNKSALSLSLSKCLCWVKYVVVSKYITSEREWEKFYRVCLLNIKFMLTFEINKVVKWIFWLKMTSINFEHW